MSVVVTFQMPVNYEQYQELNKVVNPENVIPPSYLAHVVSQHEAGLTMIDLWEDEAAEKEFYHVSTVSFSKV